MKYATKPEKFSLHRVNNGWETTPLDSNQTDLLAQLWGDKREITDLIPGDETDLPAVIARIVRVANQRGLSAQVCGNRAKQPVFILRAKSLPVFGIENPAAPGVKAWEIRINSVYGSCDYQLAYVRPEGTDEWWPAWQAPHELLAMLEIAPESLELPYQEGNTRHIVWEAFNGKREKIELGQISITLLEIHNSPTNTADRFIVGKCILPKEVTGSKFVREHIEANCDQKWMCWHPLSDEWSDLGYDHIAQMIKQLSIGQSIEIHSAPWKEIRASSVTIKRLSKIQWHVSGRVTCMWDEIYELAQTLGVRLIDGDYEEDEDGEDEEFNSESCEEAFRECIPFSSYSCEPGVDHEFDTVIRGNPEKIFLYLSKQEDEAITLDRREWETIEQVFRGNKENEANQ